jgi:response regulator RpfG family c-di-GMP phosphodiesterase
MPIALAKILVVADEPRCRTACREVLGTLHGELIEAAGPALARTARQHELALVVVYVRGSAAGEVEAVLGDEESRTWNAPVLLIVPRGTDDAGLQRAYRAGATDCLVADPGHEAVLRRKAEVFLGLQRQRAELQFTVERLARENRHLEAANAHYREQYEQLRRLAAPGLARSQPHAPPDLAEPA